MRPRDLPASFIKATKTCWPGKRQPTRAAGKKKAIDQDRKSTWPPNQSVDDRRIR